MSIPFPPVACRFYIHGACLYAEARNPGLEVRFLCARLSRLMEQWDDFLDRAEAFGLNERLALRIWTERRSLAPPSRNLCPAESAAPARVFVSDDEDISACPHLHQVSCLLLLPRCTERCERYLL
ncbi:hypothetical protein LJC59_04820 [Desulfovibrio sp. OttesenSCG-928-A18]|nr:hypothetical protein [Desulfovibrio sp. OttesenSCG-928-A18]